MKDPLKCNGCAHNGSLTSGYKCDVCQAGSMFRPEACSGLGSVSAMATAVWMPQYMLWPLTVEPA